MGEESAHDSANASLAAPNTHVTQQSIKTDPYNRKYRLPGLAMEAKEWVEKGAERRFGPLNTRKDARVDDRAIRAWLSDIEREYTGDPRHFRRNVVVDWVMHHNNVFGWTLKVPEKSVRLRLPNPPITGRNFADIARFRRLRDALTEYLNPTTGTGPGPLFAGTADGEVRDRVVGLCLLSAVAYGGLLTAQDLGAVARGSVSGAWRDDEFLMWIEWTAPEVGCCRRWLADPVTALLLLRWRELQSGPLLDIKLLVNFTADVTWSKLRNIISQLHLDPEDRPQSLTQLLHWARAWYYVETPPFLVAFASGKLPSASLPLVAWMRLLTKRPVKMESSPASADSVSELPPAVRGTGNPQQSELRRTLLGPAGKQPGLRTAQGNLDQFLQRPNILPLNRLLARWCKHLLRATSAVRADRRASTVLVYLQTVDARLSRQFASNDPAELTTDQRSGAYEAILGEASTESTRARVMSALHLFEEFLDPGSRLAQELSKRAADAERTSKVDANFISNPFLAAIMDAVGPERNPHDAVDATLREATVVLAVRAKLRRLEAWRLRLGSITGMARPELLIRSRPEEPLKSISGTRKAPLYATCTPEELGQVLAFLRDQVAAARSVTASEDGSELPVDIGNDPLFARYQHGADPIPESSLFDLITEAIQLICGDEDARFHHLRHTGLNRDLVLLMSAILPGCARILGESESELRAEIERLQTALVGRNAPTRTVLWAIAGEAGHASPSTTCGSYLHLNDWLLHCAVSRFAPVLSTRAVAALFGTTDAAARKWKSRSDGAHRWLDILARVRAKLAHAVYPSVTTSTSGIPPQTEKLPMAAPVSSAALLIDVLVAAGQPPDDLAELLEQCGAPTQRLLSTIRAYPPPSEAVARTMATTLTGLEGEGLEAVVEIAADPQRWIVAARSVRLTLSPVSVALVRDNARALNRLVGTSRNVTGRAAWSGMGIPLLASATSGHMKLIRPLPYPRAGIGHTDERLTVDYLFAAAFMLADEDRESAEHAVALILHHYSLDEHRLSFDKPSDAAKAAAFLQKLIVRAKTAGLPPEVELAFEHVPLVPRFRKSPSSDEQLLLPAAQRDAWASAVGVEARSLRQVSDRILEARGRAHGLLHITLPFHAGKSPRPRAGKSLRPHGPRVKRNSAALFLSLYAFCLLQEWTYVSSTAEDALATFA